MTNTMIDFSSFMFGYIAGCLSFAIILLIGYKINEVI